MEANAGVYILPFAPPKAGEKFSNLGTLGKSFWWHEAPPNMDYFSGKTLPQESLMKGMKEILNFLPKEFQKKKYLNFFQKKISGEKIVEILKGTLHLCDTEHPRLIPHIRL